MNKRLIAHAVEFSIFCCLSGCASISTRDVGKGLTVGGVGSGSAGLAAAGVLTEIVGSVQTEPEKGSAEYIRRQNEILRMWAMIYFYEGYKNSLLNVKEISADRVGGLTQEYCANVDRKVALKETILLDRNFMQAKGFSIKYAPESADGMIEYQLGVDPFGGKPGNCEKFLSAASKNLINDSKN